MITQEQINELNSFEIDEVIKMCRKAQRKHNPLILDIMKNFIEPPTKYTLEELYNFYLTMVKGKTVSVSKSNFNLAIIKFLNDNTLKLKNIKIKQVKPVSSNTKTLKMHGDLVDIIEK